MTRTALVSALGLMKRCTFVHLFPPRYSSNCVGLYIRLNEKVRFRQFFQRSAFGTGHGERRFFGIRSGFRDGQEFSGAFLAVGTGEMITPWEILRRVQPLEVIAKAVAVTLAYLLGFAITSHFHEASSLTGAMLACVSAIVVQQQPDIRHAVQQGWLRVLGTFIGAVVAYVYLVNFRFSPAGMVVAVVLEEVICMMFKVPDNGKMATITLIIVLIVSERSPDLSPLANGLLRFSEATVGAVVGIAAVWPVDRYRRWRQASAASSPKE